MRESGYNRGKLIEIHRDLKKNWVSDVCWIMIHRDCYEWLNSDVFCLFLPACAGVCCERKRVASREINWNTSGFEENLGFRCMLDLNASGLV